MKVVIFKTPFFRSDENTGLCSVVKLELPQQSPTADPIAMDESAVEIGEKKEFLEDEEELKQRM